MSNSKLLFVLVICLLFSVSKLNLLTEKRRQRKKPFLFLFDSVTFCSVSMSFFQACLFCSCICYVSISFATSSCKMFDTPTKIRGFPRQYTLLAKTKHFTSMLTLPFPYTERSEGNIKMSTTLKLFTQTVVAFFCQSFHDFQVCIILLS